MGADVINSTQRASTIFNRNTFESGLEFKSMFASGITKYCKDCALDGGKWPQL